MKRAELVALIESLRPGSGRAGDLAEMRDKLRTAMDLAEPRDLPRICAELRAVDAELAGLPTEVTPEQEIVDDLKRRREARRSASEG
ncbi:MAG: hypothetical protein ACRCW4_13450 [Candidatus Neomicrothrix subdominans]